MRDSPGTTPDASVFAMVMLRPCALLVKYSRKPAAAVKLAQWKTVENLPSSTGIQDSVHASACHKSALKLSRPGIHLNVNALAWLRELPADCLRFEPL